MQRIAPNLGGQVIAPWQQHPLAQSCGAPPLSARPRLGRPPEGATASPHVKIEGGCDSAAAIPWAATHLQGAADPRALLSPYWTAANRSHVKVERATQAAAATSSVLAGGAPFIPRAAMTGAAVAAVGQLTSTGVAGAPASMTVAAAADAALAQTATCITGGTAAGFAASTSGTPAAASAAVGGAVGTTDVWQLVSRLLRGEDEHGDVPILRLLARPAVAPDLTPSLPNG